MANRDKQRLELEKTSIYLLYFGFFRLIYHPFKKFKHAHSVGTLFIPA